MQVLLNTNNSPAFQAKPKAMKTYTNTIKKGLNVLNKEVGLIIHNSSTPSSKTLNTGIGSLLSTASVAAFVPFLASQGISTIQQEPSYLRKDDDPSPYGPITPSLNIYMIPIEKLASEKYGNLLSERTLRSINLRNQYSDEKVNYNNVNLDYDYALWEAYNNLKTVQPFDKLNVRRIELSAEFMLFKQNNADELTSQALYEIIAKEYNDPNKPMEYNNNWKYWNEVDQNLLTSNSKETQNRLAQLKEDYKDEIDFYMFKQWLVDKENLRAGVKHAENGIRIIGDSPVAFTPYEVWKNKDLFFEDLSLGCPPDAFSKDGQRWDFAVLKPETIFNPDGSLGKGGELLKQRYEKMFENATGGVRIDHIIGLIDPFVYTQSEPKMTDENSGRLYSSPDHPILGKYAKSTVEEYASILEKIVIPAAQKYELTKDDIICEDLGEVTQPTIEVMKRLGLSGISVTQFDHRGRDASEDNVIMIGSHDNSSFIEYTDNLFANSTKKYLRNKTGMLAEDISAPNEKVGKLQKDIIHNKKSFMRAMFTELFTSPARRVQIFFTDFFGIAKTYNIPGTNGVGDNWTLRLGKNYEDQYYDNVKNGTAPNLPEIIATAIRQRGEKFSNRYTGLLKKLDGFAQTLKD